MNTQVEMVRLSDVCDVLRGTVITKNQATSGDVPVVAGGRDAAYFTGSPNRPARMITVSGSGNAGFVNYWDVPIFASDCSTVATKDPDFAETRFLFHQLKFMEPRIMAMQQGAAQKHVYAKDVAKLQIFLPPISEQRRIAAILDKADEVRSKRKAALETLETLSQAIFIEMFGNPVTNPMGWEIRSLKEVVDRVQIGPFGSLLHKSDYIEGGLPLVNPMHISGGRIIPDSRHSVDPAHAMRLSNYVLREGDLVMGRRGEMGRCALVGPDEAGMLCGSGSLFIRPDATHTQGEYLNGLLSSSFMKRYLENEARGVTMSNLNGSIIENLPIPLPDKQLQQRYVKALQKIQSQTEAAASDDVQLAILFASLQQRAFKGEL